jgi:Spy/CpxP family protein refolding chaperone
MLLKCKPSNMALAVWLAILQVFFAMPAAFSQVVNNSTHARSGRHKHQTVHMLGVSLDLSELQLTDDQEQRIKDARKFARLKLHELKQVRTEKVTQLKAMLFDPAATDFQIRTCGEEIQQFQACIDKVNLDSLIQLRAILTPEQKSQLVKSSRDSKSVCVAAPR